MSIQLLRHIQDLVSMTMVSATDGWDLTFNPVKFEFNTYNTSTLAFSLLDGVSGIGSQNLGDIVDVTGKQVSVSTGTTTTVASFPTTNRAFKILTMVEAASGITSGRYDVELNIVHDGTTVSLLEYGDMQNTIDNYGSSTGLGTYHSYIDGGLVKIDFTPSVGTMESQTSMTLISDSGTTTGLFNFDVSQINSTHTSISSLVHHRLQWFLLTPLLMNQPIISFLLRTQQTICMRCLSSP